MTEHLFEAYRADFEARARDRKLYTVGAFPEGHAVNVHEIAPGEIYRDANVTVTAFRTKHAMESFGYRSTRPTARSSSWATPTPRRRQSMPAMAATC